jgi:hypothetical protein
VEQFENRRAEGPMVYPYPIDKTACLIAMFSGGKDTPRRRCVTRETKENPNGNSVEVTATAWKFQL